MKHILPVRFQEQQGLIALQKPTGMNTHRPDPDKPGLVELLETQIGTTLYVVHRLDKETSGILLLARSQEVAQKLTELFESQQVHKEYIFLTDRKVDFSEIEIESEISKQDSQFISRHSKNPNSKTKFIKLKSGSTYTLWKALPETGKPHQIRLHAEQVGIPILGDRLHGGSTFFRLCLHAAKISFRFADSDCSFESSIWFDENIQDSQFFHFKEALWKRQQFLDLTHAPTCRWSHDESSVFRLDQYGSQLWMNWYSSALPNLADPLFAEITHTLNKPLWIRQMKPRGSPKGQEAFLLSMGNPESKWTAEESGVHYELRSDQGLSPGLFLDQRENRAWVKSVAKEARVLNLFAYTGGFSLNACLGGAKAVCTVDVSRAFLDWTKRNFILNEQSPDSPNFEFWAQDVLLFLKGCQKRKREFDLIICDPPTLGRTKDGTFDLKRDLNELLQSCWSALAPKGRLLFSCNYEGWDAKTLQRLCQQALGTKDLKFEPAPGSPLDYESSPHDSLMKSLILCKISSRT